ncbi:hypothetical protein DL767_001839 [Monosporascus sp. MG133]|nr:hypothetical protein DL767_001839 [Monosporascus sp. MG133]
MRTPTIEPGDLLPNFHNVSREIVTSEGTWVRRVVGHLNVDLVHPVSHHSLFSSQKTYLLVSLTGDLGLSSCQWMVEHGARHLVITSRHLKVNPGIVERRKRKGAEIRLMALDVSDKKALEGAHQYICATMLPIGGVANAPMVLQDKSFDNMTGEDFKKVLSPKGPGKPEPQ